MTSTPSWCSSSSPSWARTGPARWRRPSTSVAPYCSTTAGPASARTSPASGSATRRPGRTRSRNLDAAAKAQAAWWLDRAKREKRKDLVSFYGSLSVGRAASRSGATRWPWSPARRPARSPAPSSPTSSVVVRRSSRPRRGWTRRGSRSSASSTATTPRPVPPCGCCRPTWPRSPTSTHSSSGSPTRSSRRPVGRRPSCARRSRRRWSSRSPLPRCRARRPTPARAPRWSSGSCCGVSSAWSPASRPRVPTTGSGDACTSYCRARPTAACSAGTVRTARPRPRSTPSSPVGRPRRTGRSGSPWPTRTSAGSAAPA